jgi:hypothetical protein
MRSRPNLFWPWVVMALATPASNAADAPRPVLGLSAVRTLVEELHTECLKPVRSPRCTADRWWEVTLRVQDSKELSEPRLVHFRELYLAVSRSWRGHLSGSVAKDFDLQFAKTLMERARGWSR